MTVEQVLRHVTSSVLGALLACLTIGLITGEWSTWVLPYMAGVSMAEFWLFIWLRREFPAVPMRRCLVHAESYVDVCRGCRADDIAAEVGA